MRHRRSELLLSRILGALGVGSASLTLSVACGGVAETRAGAESSGGSGGTGSAPSSGGTWSTGGTLASTGGTSTGGVFGVGGLIATGGSGAGPSDYWEYQLESAGGLSVELVEQLCNVPWDTYYNWTYICFQAPPNGASCTEFYAAEPLERSYNCGLITGAGLVCGPSTPLDGMTSPSDSCCYLMGGTCAIGRPFLIDGVARAAETIDSSEWLQNLAPSLAALDEETRLALADAFAQDGAREHASVASFARFTLQCLALGAPASLVSAAQKAGLEEIEHARIHFGLASAYGGRSVGPGPLDIRGAFDEPNDVRSVAVAVAREGCIAETISALLVAAARDAAEDPVVRKALTAIAQEELEHALLAWRFVQWALATGSAETRAAIAEVFETPEAWVGLGALTSRPGSAQSMRAHGYLDASERRSIAVEGLRNVVGPAATALLAGYPSEPEPAPARVSANLQRS